MPQTEEAKVRLCFLHNQLFETKDEADKHMSEHSCSAVEVKREDAAAIQEALSSSPMKPRLY